ncbi:PrsW family intramembrane metalloprotease [Streptomyces luteolus]|uniref:PrsW family intramembrane metalloprotease n=1 Tax=Streptomyces luteolus TaxID=3043615 RepID=A0ABT6T2W3_9ACTN|nr:PrsW family intramembrane metalloprotease [Streptomyces sp. B-S-A12]MDI3421750.1 PrsW family intramembrane metalloprotease [Streptomyces sp. B-S-A12]
MTTHPGPAPTARPRGAVLLAVAVIAAVGTALLARTFARSVIVFPSQTLTAIAVCAVFAAIGWWLLRRLNPLVPADRRSAAACLAWGLLPATGFAVLANGGLTSIWSRVLGLETGSAWRDALSAPVNEELLKIAGVLLLALALAPRVRGPLDGFVLGAFAGFGFQVTENVIYGIQSAEATGGTGTTTTVVTFLYERFLTALSSHWAMSALAGTGLGYLIARRAQRWAVVRGVALIALAMALHLFFDSPLIATGPGGTLRALLAFVVAMAVYLSLRHRFRRAAADHLRAHGHDPGLLRRRTRRKARRAQPDRAARRRTGEQQRHLLTETAEYAHRTT